MSAEYAAAIAPEFDRIRIAIVRGVTPRVGPLAAEVGMAPETGMYFAMLRLLGPGQAASLDGFRTLFVYQPAAATAGALDDMEVNGLITIADNSLRLTDGGVAAIERILAITSDVVEEMWRGEDVDFGRLRAITGKAIDAAAPTGGPAFSVLAPMYEPEGMALSARVAETLSPLRFHRFDAHIAAWRAAGLTVAEVQALEDGPVKDAIEADTNERAAAAYATLTDDERTTLLDGLRSLPTPTVAS